MIMINICDESLCTGCRACEYVCPKAAISFKADKEGFLKPKIDYERCISCFKCIHSCQINKKIDAKKCDENVLAMWTRDKKKRMESTSGGVFGQIAENFIKNGGVVYGAVYDEDFNVVHNRISDMNMVSKLYGSKYVQSDLKDIYKLVISDLKNNIEVLFSGTPCQIAALKLICGKNDFTNLFTIDLVCHGVPSPMIFNDYKEMLQKKYKSRIRYINMRSKKKSWQTFDIEVHFENNRRYFKSTYKDPYIRGFLRNLYLRSSCYKCKYSSIERVSDLTLGDFWCYRQHSIDDFDDDRGISLVMKNTRKANLLLDGLDNFCAFDRPLSDAIYGNKALSNCFEEPDNKIMFWDEYHKYGFERVIKDYLYPEKTPFYSFQKRFIGRYLKKVYVLKKYILNKIKNKK